ncbi:hypothetical protein EDB85DRAFT_1889513 [Lactarius pseudohatsudake]|nr:hypothetical protein EDB85DRAFT_1889513 [Lactarius pseudohatsudake]
MHSEVQKMQMEQEKHVANDCPHLDTNHLPIALLYKGFGHFLDVAAGASTDPVFDINQRQFELNVDKFMMSMNAYYPAEDERNDEALNFLNKIFQCCLGERTQKLLPGIVHKGRCSDGHALGPADTIEVILEVKNELGSGHADPTIELTAYYMQSLKHLTTNLRSHFFFPALGIIVVGSHIGFYAFAYPNFSARLVALTPLLPTMAESGNNWVRPALLNAFRAACVLHHHIYEDTKASAEVSTTQIALPSQLPYVDQVAAYSTPGIIRFHIQVEGHAPQLLGYGDIPGGWHIVVMEWINHEDTNLKSFAPEHLPRWSNDLKSTVKAFHHKGWVHGDLRDANLIVGNQEPERMLLVDFDWGGDTTTRPVYFPATTLVNEELIPGHLGSSQITKEHDDHVLASTLEKLAGFNSL